MHRCIAHCALVTEWAKHMNSFVINDEDIEIFDYEGPFRDSFEICVQPNREYRVGLALWTSEADQVLCDSHAISFEPHRNWKVERQGHIQL